MELTYIYAHLEPFEDEIFYIGKSDDPWSRLSGHLRDAKVGTYHQANKLRKLAAQGLEPRVEIISEVPVEEWEFWERHYIKYFRDLGFDLTNATPGGEGLGSGPAHPSYGNAANKGVPKSLVHRQKLREANLGKKLSPEVREKIGAAQRGRKRSLEARENIRKGCFGRKASPEAREKMRQAHLGRKQSPELVVMRIAKSVAARKLNRERRRLLGGI